MGGGGIIASADRPPGGQPPPGTDPLSTPQTPPRGRVLSLVLREVFFGRHLPGLYAYLEVRLPNGTTVMMSESYDTDPNPLDDLPVGRHVVTATIPPRTLAPGKYDVHVSLKSTSGHDFIVHSPDIVGSFRLHDSTSLVGNARPGFFSTLLQWQATELSPGEE